MQKWYIFVLILADLSKPLPEERPQTELLLICIIRSILMRNVEDITKKQKDFSG